MYVVLSYNMSIETSAAPSFDISVLQSPPSTTACPLHLPGALSCQLAFKLPANTIHREVSFARPMAASHCYEKKYSYIHSLVILGMSLGSLYSNMGSASPLIFHSHLSTRLHLQVTEKTKIFI